MTKIILINGYAEHGKTSVALEIKRQLDEENYKVVKVSFADYLKFIAKTYFDWDGQKNDYGRSLLQYLGTDVVRKINPEFWAMAGWNFVTTFGQLFDYIIFDDCRFPNEISIFKNSGFSSLSIRVSRLNEDGSQFENSLSPEQRLHPSETALSFYASDIFLSIQTGKDNVREEVESFLGIIKLFK